MPRIRSVHPSLFTDEAWVGCSPMARVFYIGLLTDADDHGLFEWKPLQLKMRLLPADNTDVAALLGELVTVDLIATFDASGKKLGAIRRFCRFQRPKKPNYKFPLPPEWHTYVGLDGSVLDGPSNDDGSEPVGVEFSTSTEPVPQTAELAEHREEGGDDKEPPLAPQGVATSVRKADIDAIWAITPKRSRERSGRADVERALTAAARRGKPPDQVLAGLRAYFASEAATKDDCGFVKGVHRMIEGDRWESFVDAGPLVEIAEANPWRGRLLKWTRAAYWNALDWGPKPGADDCQCPPEILREFDIEPAKPTAVGSAA